MGLHALQAIVSQNFPLKLTNPSSLSRLICSFIQTGQSTLGRERGRPTLRGGRIPTVYII